MLTPTLKLGVVKQLFLYIFIGELNRNAAFYVDFRAPDNVELQHAFWEVKLMGYPCVCLRMCILNCQNEQHKRFGAPDEVGLQHAILESNENNMVCAFAFALCPCVCLCICIHHCHNLHFGWLVGLGLMAL